MLFNCRALFTIRQTMGKHYDVIIAGGGLVGTAMACALGRHPKLASRRILMLEGSPRRSVPPKKTSDPYSNRVVSLNPGTKQFFQALGVWDRIAEVRCKAVKKMQVWETCSDALITFEQPGLLDDVSYIVENEVILHAFQSQLGTTKDHVQVRHNSRVNSITLPQHSNDKPSLRLEGDGETYTCDLVIGAEGSSSTTRQAMGSQWLNWSYDQSGVVATLQLAEPTENVVAWQRFLPCGTGPIAILPLTNDLSSLVWSTTSKNARRLLDMTDEAFVDSVNDALWKPTHKPSVVDSAGRWLERITGVSPAAGQQLPPSISAVIPGSRAAFPLEFGHAARYVAPSAALIGDAAHRIHPLAGQGVNLGFGDVECLANIIAEAAYSGQKLGSLLHLLEYERQRQCYNFPTMLAIDGLQKLFSFDATPVVLLRSLGMQITHSLLPLKRALMDHASH